MSRSLFSFHTETIISKQSPAFGRFVSVINSPMFFILWFLLIIVSYRYLDMPLTHYLHYHLYPAIYLVAIKLTALGVSTYYLVALLLVCFISYFFIKRETLTRYCFFLFTVVLSAGIVCDVLKVIIARARPIEFYQHHMSGIYFFKLQSHFWSFPSGHSSSIASVMLAAALVFPRYWYFFILSIIPISLSRVIVGDHYLSDVLAGIYLGFIICLGVFNVFQKKAWLQNTVATI